MDLGLVGVTLSVSFALAFLSESLVEYLIGTPLDHVGEPAKRWKWLLMYISAAVGVGLCWYWQVDLIAVVANVTAKLSGLSGTWSISPVGVILSGLIVGRGSNYLHDFLDKHLVKPAVPGMK